MATMSNYFVTKSMEATSFDYDRDAHPDPQETHNLFEWLDDNVSEFTTFPQNHFILLTDFSTVTFKDTSQVIIQSVYINDWIRLTEKVNPYSQGTTGGSHDPSDLQSQLHLLQAHGPAPEKALKNMPSHPSISKEGETRCR